MAPDPDKVKAVSEMQLPSSVKELQTFLGMTNCLSRFTPNILAMSVPLCNLCKKGTHFAWGPEHQSAFDNVKAAIPSAAVLQYFDSGSLVII